jgi:hypothetical protein
MTTESRPKTATELVDEHEEALQTELNYKVAKSMLFQYGEVDPSRPDRGVVPVPSTNPKALALQGHDPRLQVMPEKPTVLDFFQYRWGYSAHLLQSATHALKAGCDEETILACLLHDIGVVGFIRSDHGYWGAQLVEPYVSEKVAWAIRSHQVLRFYADESYGYSYPEMYIRLFGEDFKPEPYIEAEYKRIREHKWYEASRLITVNDIYSFDPTAVVNIEDFYDIVGRNFRQPEEGLGFDNSPVAHMWRTLIWPNRYL